MKYDVRLCPVKDGQVLDCPEGFGVYSFVAGSLGSVQAVCVRLIVPPPPDPPPDPTVVP